MPVLLIVTEGGLAVVNHDWGMDDVALHTCGPAEREARIKLAIGRLNAQRVAAYPEAHWLRSGEVVVDECRRQRMHVDHAIDAVMAFLQGNEFADGAEIVAEMQIAGRLDAGKDKGLEGHLFSSWLVEGRFARGEIPGRALMDHGRAEGKRLEHSFPPGRTV